MPSFYAIDITLVVKKRRGKKGGGFVRGENGKEKENQCS